ncbi:MAG: primase C-terminal domain-containing protein [Kurthia sp.]|nr:primase C-terminal domain-containing protein [Candidatus Kurthia equi]
MKVDKENISTLYKTLLKGGLNKAAVFGVHSKTDFIDVSTNGKVFNTIEMLLKSVSKLSHFTPNTYKEKENKTVHKGLYGFTERNLQQINTFVVDIDNLDYSLQDILLACLDYSIGAPTMVIRTPNGHQVYFILNTPMFMSAKKNYHSLHVAKRISTNLKVSLESVEADRYCNDFGFFRVPTINNIVWLQLDQLYTVEDMINFSMRMDDNHERELYAPGINPAKTKYLETAAFQHILTLTNIKGHSGKVGRNNTIFTIALACYSDGLSQFEATKLLYQFNQRLKYPIKNTEIAASIRSAYSGRYNGPNKIYVDQIIGEHSTYINSFNRWYKFKKERSDRKYSHLEEWETDIIQFLETIDISNSPYIQLTQKELCDIIGCQQSSLNAILKKTTKIIKVVIGKGRSAITKWSTNSLIMQHLLLKRRQSDCIQKEPNITIGNITFQSRVKWEVETNPLGDSYRLNNTS